MLNEFLLPLSRGYFTALSFCVLLKISSFEAFVLKDTAVSASTIKGAYRLEKINKKPTGPMYFVFCRLYPRPPSYYSIVLLLPAISLHTTLLKLYRGCGLAYSKNW
jgi:hypothetical protein